MSLTKPLLEMDVLVAAGKFHEAVERYFADHGKAVSPGDDFQANNKEEKKASLSHFLQHIKHTNHISLHRQSENGNVSESAFTFHFTDHHDNPLIWHEIIRRHWENGLVVLEEYIMMDKPAEATAKEKASGKPKSSKEGTPGAGSSPAGNTVSAASKTTTTSAKSSPSAAPAKAETAAPKTASPKKTEAAKPDDLKKIEGVGPKIEELLKKAGINTFSELATAPTEKLKGVLDAAGPRFQMHDPATWAKQAKLAADGEWEKLKTWQDELKGGIVK